MENYEKLLELSHIKGVNIYFDTKWLFNRTLRSDLNSVDLIIRLLAIDNYLGKNEFGFELYNKMQQKRIATNREIPKDNKDYENEFKKLIQSIEINGYDTEKPVELNKRFEVFDGAHRLACAVAFNIHKIPVKFSQKYINKTYDYSLEWFRNNGLSNFETYIMEKYQELVKKEIIVGDKYV